MWQRPVNKMQKKLSIYFNIWLLFPRKTDWQPIKTRWGNSTFYAAFIFEYHFWKYIIYVIIMNFNVWHESFSFFVQNVSVLFLLYLTGVVGAICFIIVFFYILLSRQRRLRDGRSKGRRYCRKCGRCCGINQTGVPDIAKRQEFFM